MEKGKNNYKLKKNLYSFGIASVLLMTGCNGKYSQEPSVSQSSIETNDDIEKQKVKIIIEEKNEEPSISQSSIETNDDIEKQEVKISIEVSNEEELVNALNELKADLPTIITNYKVSGLEISSALDEKSIEVIELVKNIALSCPDLRELSIPRLYMEYIDSTWISSLTNLTYLDISANYNLTDISFVETLTNLEVLDISVTNIEDISSLANLTNLRVLDVSSTYITDCSVIESLPNLTELDMDFCPYLNESYRNHYENREDIEELINLINENARGYRLIFDD